MAFYNLFRFRVCMAQNSRNISTLYSNVLRAEHHHMLYKLSRTPAVCHHLRFMSSNPNWKSLPEIMKENRATLNDMSKPRFNWNDYTKSRNARFNRNLAISLAALGITFVIMNKAGVFYFHGTPDYKRINVDATKPLNSQSHEPLPPQKPAASILSSVMKTKDDMEYHPPAPQPIPDYKLPEKVPYLIIGAGTAAFAAYRAIRSTDPKAQVLLLGDEPHVPYMRPPLSKELWYSKDKNLVEDMKFMQWNTKQRSIYYEKEEFFSSPEELTQQEFGGVAIARGKRVQKIDVANQIVFTADGQKVKYDKCLIATGGKPKNLQIIEDAGSEVIKRTTLFRNVEDFKRLNFLTNRISSVAIVGGGFLGSELACALGNRKLERQGALKIYQIFPEVGNMGKVFPEYLSRWTMNKVEKEGVEVMPNTILRSCSYNPSTKKVVLGLDDGKKVEVDHVIVAVGLQANTDLANTSGLEVDPIHGGFLVNAELEARKNLWVAGDAACFYDIKLGRRRVEHHDHAVVSGRLAGENMAGNSKPYWHQSMFWSDLGPNIGYEAIGIVDSLLPTVAVFAKATMADTPKAVVEKTGENLRSETEQGMSEAAESMLLTESSLNQEDDFGKGVIFYLKNHTVVGVLLWNVFGKMPIARKLIKDAIHEDQLAEAAKLFKLHKVGEEEQAVESGADTETLG